MRVKDLTSEEKRKELLVPRLGASEAADDLTKC